MSATFGNAMGEWLEDYCAPLRQRMETAEAEVARLEAALRERSRLVDEWKEAAEENAKTAGRISQDRDRAEAALATLRGEVAPLEAALVNLVAAHDGYRHGAGPCVCAAHEDARRILEAARLRRAAAGEARANQQWREAIALGRWALFHETDAQLAQEMFAAALRKAAAGEPTRTEEGA